MVRKRAVRKVACFEDSISVEHREWLEAQNIQVMWQADTAFDAAASAQDELRGHFGF